MKFSFIVLIIIIASCHIKQKPFSIEDWNYKEDIFYTKRKYLVDDLINHIIYKGMSYNSVTKLLGQPENYVGTENTIEYDIEEIYRRDIDPVQGSYLELTLNQDSIVTGVKHVKWKH
jgi:hypothetical protein